MNIYLVRHGEVLSNVLIVAHSGFSKAFSSYFDGIQDDKF